MAIDTNKQGIINWFINNPVAANLLMIIVLVMGYFSVTTIRLESFPVAAPNLLSITVNYDEGTIEDVEKSILIKIEQVLAGVQGIKSYSGTAMPTGVSVYVEKQESYDIEKLRQDIQRQLDGISTFPKSAEPSVISSQKEQESVVWVSIQGDATEFELKQLASSLRNQLLRKPNVSKVDYLAPREYEVSIYLSREKLQQYHLSFAEVAEALRSHTLEVNAGFIKTDNGEVLITVNGAVKSDMNYGNIAIRSSILGGNLYLHDVAVIDTSLSSKTGKSFYNDSPTITLAVKTEGSSDIVAAYQEVENTTEIFTADLPNTISVKLWQNNAKLVVDRLEFSSRSGLMTMLLVLLVLAIFLDLRLAFWVAIGIPVSFAGALILMPMDAFGLSLNTVTLFAFIIVLGIVVDDAIIIGESIYTAKETQPNPISSTLTGVHRIAIPATFGVLTTVAAFWPLTRIASDLGAIFSQIGWVVIFCLIFSLVESKLILPTHLKNIRLKSNNSDGLWLRFQNKTQQGIVRFTSSVYRGFLLNTIKYRWLTLLSFIALFILSIGLLATGLVKEIFFPEIEPEFIESTLLVDSNMSVDEIADATKKLTSSLRTVSNRMLQQGVVEHAPITDIYSQYNDNEILIVAELDEVKRRQISATELKTQWDQEVGEIEGVSLSSFQDTGVDLDIQLYGKDLDALQMASRELEKKLREYKPIKKVIRSDKKSKPEYRLLLTQEGRAKGISNKLLSEQVRNAFNGIEVQRIQVEGEEVKVMLRLPEQHRKNIADLQQFRIMNNQGAGFPLSTVADVVLQKSSAYIYRENGERMVSVSADIDKQRYSPNEVLEDLDRAFLKQLKSRYPEIRIAFAGDAEEEDIAVASLISGFVTTALLIYLLLAIPLKSYLSPLVIISVIPFGFIGVIAGHLIIGIPISLLSFFGFLALCGVVVNDSLILVTTIRNDDRLQEDPEAAVVAAAIYRFRAVVLTSLTTFIGLTPIIFASSYQSQLFVPTAVSLGFGIVFSTLTTLILVPSIYLIGNDMRSFKWKR